MLRLPDKEVLEWNTEATPEGFGVPERTGRVVSEFQPDSPLRLYTGGGVVGK